MKTIFITGIAGMIGMHSALKFKELGWRVEGIDNFNDFYDVDLKKARQKKLNDAGIIIKHCDIKETDRYLDDLKKSDIVLHLAAYANTRHSKIDPYPYIETNIEGTQRLLDLVEKHNKPVVYASSSCVCHGQPLPWNETDLPIHQNNAYGWSKRINECQFLNSTLDRSAGLRFFTVYGEWGRPDMSLYDFAKNIANGESIGLFNNGMMKRDFTYVGDIVQGIELVVNHTLENKGHEIFNIGSGRQTELLAYVSEIEQNLGKKAVIKLLPPESTEALETWADTSKMRSLGYKPTTTIEDGIKKFVEWFKEYHNV